MQDLDNDMEEFIRQAARDYPFHLQDDAWEYVAGKIDSVGSKGNRNKGLLLHFNFNNTILIFLFALLISICFFFSSEVDLSEIQIRKIGWATKNPDFDLPLKSIPTGLNHKPLSKTPGSVPKMNNSELYKFDTEKLLKAPRQDADQILTRSDMSKNRDSLICKSLVPELQTTTEAELLKPAINKKKALLYIGLIAGPQFNQINSQRISHAGGSLGLLVGWQFSNRLSLETGINFSLKKYHTSGEYFNMKKVSESMPPGMKIISLSGKSYVTEIPLMIKYDVLASGNNRIFASGGIASYILTKETNQYKGILNGSVQKMIGNYTKASPYYMATANFSAGYENQIGKGVKMRIAPYVQIPLAGFGVGSLHILSAGLNLGISVPVIRK